MNVQRWIQGLALVLFAGLIWEAARPWVPADLFLQLDPSAAAAAGIASRRWVAGLGWAMLLLALTALLGRFFCGYLCPLGTTVDCGDYLIRRGRPCPGPGAAPRRLKFAVLAALLGAASLGVSLVFFLSPIPMATRLYGVLVVPVIQRISDWGLAALGPLADLANLPALGYAEIASSRYLHPWTTAVITAAVLGLAVRAPRFWCRAVCPAGAIFALCSRRPLWSRRVTDDCIDCGLCQRACPMGAIDDDPRPTDRAECIVCRTCARVCPANAVFFDAGLAPTAPFSADRRLFISGGLAGAAAAAVSWVGAEHLLSAAGPGQILPPELIRPPGSLTEPRFQSLCIRCGACMAACPTNTLHPLSVGTGPTGVFTPVVTPRIGPCDPYCTRCGEVCPTGAIRNLTADERLWAKVGTAHILRQKCLAWEFDRKCLVCDEVCPFGAVSLKTVEGIPAQVPFVDERRCTGCGFCEYHCPVASEKAIQVAPMEALRLDAGSFVERGREAGLTIELKRRASVTTETPEATGAPGDLPPGFSD
ncbi:MAG: 4Fe-4S binding protein [Desulfobacterales bacterium]|jgi:MauM/NapG family ferredoxin protein